MKRPQINYLVDWAALSAFMLLVATGLLLHFRLPAGSGDASLLGLTRHEWGDVHFWIAMAMVTLIALHLLLHAKWISAMSTGEKKARRPGLKLASAVGGLALLIGIVAAGLLWPVVPSTREPGRRGAAAAPSHASSQQAGQHDAQDAPPDARPRRGQFSERRNQRSESP